MNQQTIAPRTKTGVALPEGNLSPSNYVGDPSGGRFIAWDREFMQKGLPAPMEANEHGTPAMWKGRATGFGKLPGGHTAPLEPPMHGEMEDSDGYTQPNDGGPTGTGQPYYPGITGDNPYDGSNAARTPPRANGARVPAPEGVPPAAKMIGGVEAPQMPFADQLAPIMARMHGRMERGVDVVETHAPPTQQHEPPKQQRPLETVKPGSMHGAMGDTWIDWEAGLLGLMGEAPNEPPPPPGQGAAPPAGPAAPQPQPRQTKNAGAGGRGAERAPFTYGQDDAESQGQAQKSIVLVDELLKGLVPFFDDGELLEKGEGGSHKYVSRTRGATGWIYKYADTGEKVDRPTKLESADDHVAHVLHQMGPKHGEHMQIHVTEPSGDERKAQEIGVHVGGQHQTTFTHTKKWGPIVHSMSPSLPSGFDARKAHDAFNRHQKMAAKRHGKDAVTPAPTSGAPASTAGRPAPEKPAAKPLALTPPQHQGAKASSSAEYREAARHARDFSSSAANATDDSGKSTQHSQAAWAHGAAAKAARSVGDHEAAAHHESRATEHKKHANDARARSGPPIGTPRGLPNTSTEKSMDSVKDVYGRDLSKGIYAFRGTRLDAALPEEYLYDYLCAFIEEAYEQESREPAHRTLNAKEQLSTIATAVMNELVQTIPGNPNLMRATKKYKVNAAGVAQILVQRGIYKPRADSEFSGDDPSYLAMGAPALVGEAMAFSVPPSGWFKSESAPVVLRTMVDHTDDASSLVKSDYDDPHLHVTAREGARVRALWKSEDVPAQASPSCPVHGGREYQKSQNLWNPMQPCTCHGKPNAYG